MKIKEKVFYKLFPVIQFNNAAASKRVRFVLKRFFVVYYQNGRDFLPRLWSGPARAALAAAAVSLDSNVRSFTLKNKNQLKIIKAWKRELFLLS